MKTAGHIAELIKQGEKDFPGRQSAIDILIRQGVRPKDYHGEIKALFEWVQEHVRYTKDTVRVEVLHSALRMLECEQAIATTSPSCWARCWKRSVIRYDW